MKLEGCVFTKYTTWSLNYYVGTEGEEGGPSKCKCMRTEGGGLFQCERSHIKGELCQCERSHTCF